MALHHGAICRTDHLKLIEGSLPVVTFTVHEPPSPPADRIDRADALAFVKDGFSWLTAFSPLLGFAQHSLWLAAVAYFVALAAVVAVLNALGVDSAWIALLVTALNIYLGFELSTVKRWTLDQGGWRTLGTVTGRSIAECERRFMESWLPAQPAVTTQRDGQASSLPFAANR